MNLREPAIVTGSLFCTPCNERDLMNPNELRDTIKLAFLEYTSLDMTSEEWKNSPDKFKWKELDKTIEKFILNHNTCLTFIPLEQLGKAKRIFIIKKKPAACPAVKALQIVIEQKAAQRDAEKKAQELKSRLLAKRLVRSVSVAAIEGRSGFDFRTTDSLPTPKELSATLDQQTTAFTPVTPSGIKKRKERKSRTRTKSLLLRSDSLTSSVSMTISPQERRKKKREEVSENASMRKSQSVVEIPAEKNSSRNLN